MRELKNNLLPILISSIFIYPITFIIISPLVIFIISGEYHHFFNGPEWNYLLVIILLRSIIGFSYSFTLFFPLACILFCFKTNRWYAYLLKMLILALPSFIIGLLYFLNQSPSQHLIRNLDECLSCPMAALLSCIALSTLIKKKVFRD